jgi:hypothetical protein
MGLNWDGDGLVVSITSGDDEAVAYLTLTWCPLCDDHRLGAHGVGHIGEVVETDVCSAYPDAITIPVQVAKDVEDARLKIGPIHLRSWRQAIRHMQNVYANAIAINVQKGFPPAADSTLVKKWNYLYNGEI